jgi:hypothetical protein
VTPEYDKTTGRLVALVGDADQNGQPDTRAVMDGTRLERVEIDRNGDGRIDRVEFYVPGGRGAKALRPSMLRAEELDGSGQVVRRETYASGGLAHTEEDTDGNGRPDKWETYVNGILTRVDLDLTGGGRPERRLVYGPGGSRSIEVDPDGDGVFIPDRDAGQSHGR